MHHERKKRKDRHGGRSKGKEKSSKGKKKKKRHHHSHHKKKKHGKGGRTKGKRKKQKNTNATVNNAVSEMSVVQVGGRFFGTRRSPRRSLRPRISDVEAAGVDTSFSNRRYYRNPKAETLETSSKSSLSIAKRDLKSVPNFYRHHHLRGRNVEGPERDSLRSLTSLKSQNSRDANAEALRYQTRCRFKQISPVASPAHINLLPRSRSGRHVRTFALEKPPYHDLNINRSHTKIKPIRKSDGVKSFSGEHILARKFSRTEDVEETGKRENPAGNKSMANVDHENRLRQNKIRSRRSLYRVLIDSFLSNKNETYKELSLPKGDNLLLKENEASMSRNATDENQMHCGRTQKSHNNNEKENVAERKVETQHTKNIPVAMALDKCASKPTVSSFNIFEAASCSSVHVASKRRREDSSKDHQQTLPRERPDRSCNRHNAGSRDAKLQGNTANQKSPGVRKMDSFVAAPPAEESGTRGSYFNGPPGGAEAHSVHGGQPRHETDINVNFQPSRRPDRDKDSECPAF